MKNKFDIYRSAQTKAIYGILNETDESFFRRVCRWYSSNFNTSLHVVMEGNVIAWDDVLRHYYEDMLERRYSYNELYDYTTKQFIPELADDFEEENKKFAEELVKEQQKSLKAKEKKEKVENKEPEKEFKPINMSFEDEEI